MYFQANIKLLRHRRKRTQDELAFSLGMKRSTLSGYENGVARPGIEALLKFSKYFGIAIDTLIQIDLSKLSESQFAQLERGADVYIKSSQLRILATMVTADNSDNIELVSEKAKAGYKQGFADPEYIKQLPVFRLPFLSPNRKYRSFQLKGDSMLPIPDGAWVTGEYVQDWSSVVSGHAYIIFTLEDGIMFKIVENLIENENKLMLYSLNPAYEPYDVYVSEIKEIWKFVNYISSEISDPLVPGTEIYAAVARVKSDMERLKRMINKRKK